MERKVPFKFIFVLIFVTNGVHGGFSSVCKGDRSSICRQLGLKPQCDSQIFCQGELLCTIQMARIFPDSKTFVDMKLKVSEADALAKFKIWKSNYPDPTVDHVKQFVQDNFDDVGLEFEDWIPTDHKNATDLMIMKKIIDPQYQKWAEFLHGLWLVLGRKMKDKVIQNPSQYSIVPVKNPFIVPGGRFREFYYWDSYWVIKGLLSSEMYDTARGMLQNFLEIVDTYGFVLNGGRIYYTGRSQPPLLTPIFKDFFDATNDLDFIIKSLPTLEAEFQHWCKNHAVYVNGRELYKYVEKTCGPRPESYYEDVMTASSFEYDKDRENLYSEIKATASSGMDFSTRWYIKNGTNAGELKDLKTRSIVPVDLNAWMYYIADILSEFYHKKQHNGLKAKLYELKKKRILEAMDHVLWDKDEGIWLDYDLVNKKRRNYFVASNFLPLYTKSYDPSKAKQISDQVLGYIKRNYLDCYVSLPNTLVESGQQWDFPNVWPPMQHIAVMGLDKLGTKEAQEMAKNWAARYLRSCYTGCFNGNHTHMYEKYSAVECGLYGDGGEYDVQLGFGWSNGVALKFLEKYGDTLSSTDDQMLKCTHLPCFSCLLQLIE